MKKTLALAVLAVMAANLSIFAADIGSSGWNILRMVKSAKPAPLSNCAYNRGDVSGIFYNPAVVGTIQKNNVSLMMESGLAQDTLQGAVFGMKGLSFGYVSYDTGMESVLMEEGGVEVERFLSMQKDTMGIVAAGFAPAKGLTVGFSGKYVTSAVAETAKGSAVCADIGATYAGGKSGVVVVSGALQNIGPAAEIGGSAQDLPLSAWMGAACALPLARNSSLGLGIDGKYLVKEGRLLPGAGIEYSMGGVEMSVAYNAAGAGGSLQFGLGMNAGDVGLTYAFQPSQYLNPAHRFNVNFSF